MPISKPVARDHIHTRSIQCTGYKRQDGLWDIDGTMTDTKTYTFENLDRSDIPSGEPIHHMVMRITVDDDLVVHAAEAATEFAPYHICGDITPTFAKLEGLQIGPGWRRQVNQLMGGTGGCTHLRDMLIGPLAVTAYQTIIPMRRKMRGPTTEQPTRRPAIIGTCHAYAPDGPVVERQWPQFFEQPE
ncbi:MAG: DUF2889 domain-containing protein [Rhodospirillales bacterium]|nr:DUF2889 domain-containing protein [Rhodospirillales bacterium]